jgi:DNA-binding response OmpR family regulator
MHVSTFGQSVPTSADERLADVRAGLAPIIVVAANEEQRERIARILSCSFDPALWSSQERGRPMIQVGELLIDKEAYRAYVDGAAVALTGLEFRLLVKLVDCRERVQSRGSLLCDVWSINSDNQTRTVDTHITRLRRKLGKAGRFIQSVRGVGYRFSESAAVEVAPERVGKEGWDGAVRKERTRAKLASVAPSPLELSSPRHAYRAAR